MEPVAFTLTQVIDLERPAWHEDQAGRVDFIYDGITFWRGRVGDLWAPEPGERLPQTDWRHKPDCRCEHCREARAQRKRRRKPQ